MVITKLERQQKNPLRVNVYCDDAFAFGIHQDVLVKFGLRKGDVVDEKSMADLLAAEEFRIAKEKALKFLGGRLRSKKELRSKLIDKEIDPHAVDSVIEHLEGLGLINDKTFAEAFVHDAIMKKPSGSNILRQRLRLKGINRAVIDDVLHERLSRETEVTLARKAASKQLIRLRGGRKELERQQQQKRMADFLMRRGFAWDTVSTVLKELFPHSKNVSSNDIDS